MKFRGKYGGACPGSRRKSILTGRDRRPVSVVLTREGRRLIKATARRLGISGSNVVEALLRAHASTVQVPPSPLRGRSVPRRTPSSSITFLQNQSSAEVQARLASFADAYKNDWERWLETCAKHDLNDRPAILEFKRILGKWQAVRPRRLARLDEAVHGTKTLPQVVRTASRLSKRLGTTSLRTLHRAGRRERRALLDLWELFASSLADNGEAGCVGITKAIMLITGGNIGRAFDSRVRRELGIAAPTTAESWIATLYEIGQDLAAFESASGKKLDGLVRGSWRAVGVGRAYDMAAGPRSSTNSSG
jgi:hypothetical protein